MLSDRRQVLRERALTPRSADVESAIELRGVDVHIGLQPILRGVDLTVEQGQAVALTGSNGSGKTTLLHVLATLLRPSAGTVRLMGNSWTDAAHPKRRRAIALVGHRSGLHPDLTLAENLGLVARLAGVEGGRVAVELDRVGLGGAAGRRLEACSEGMVRRAELARVGLTQPSLLLLDEAHGALDRDARSLVEAATRTVTGRGGVAVLVTHSPQDLRSLVDQQLVLHGGRLRAAVR